MTYKFVDLASKGIGRLLIFLGILVERFNSLEVEVNCKPNSTGASWGTINGKNFNLNKGSFQWMMGEL